MAQRRVPKRPSSSGRSSPEQLAVAEALAIDALGFIAAEPERLGRFLAVTGIGPDSIRQAAREPRFLAGVLDHLASDERLLMDFATEHEVDPDDVMRARDVIAGRRWERDTP